MNSLFSKPRGVSVGDVFINKELEAKGEPHPMRVVRVKRVDDTGMILLVSNIYGIGGMEHTVTNETLRKEYRSEKEGNDK